MAPENKSKSTNSNKNNKRRKNYLPHNKPVKKGAYAIWPGVEGFFITCDGGREYQASQEAINVIDSTLILLEATVMMLMMKIPIMVMQRTKMTGEEKDKIVLAAGADGIKDNQMRNLRIMTVKKLKLLKPAAKRQCVEADAPNCEKLCVKVEQKSVDKLIEDELKELGDKSKLKFHATHQTRKLDERSNLSLKSIFPLKLRTHVSFQCSYKHWG